MAFPTTLPNCELPSGGYGGPVQNGTDMYFFARSSAASEDGVLVAWKSTDPENGSWASQDDATNTPALSVTTALESLDHEPDGTDVHIVGGYADISYMYARFSMSSDTWTDVDTGDDDISIDAITNGSDNASAPDYGCGICKETTGSDLIVVYGGEAVKSMGTYYSSIHYARSTDAGVTWSAGNIVDDINQTGSGNVDWVQPRCIIGDSDRVHVVYCDHTNLDGYDRTITSADSVSSRTQVFTSLSSNADQSTGPMLKDGSTIYIQWRSTSGITVYSGTSADDVTWSSVATATNTLGGGGNTTVNRACQYLRDSAGDEVSIHRREDADQDLYRRDNLGGAGWSTSTELTDAVLVNQINAATISRSGTETYCYVWDDNGTIKYDEEPFAPPPATQSLNATAVGTATLSDALIKAQALNATATGTAVITDQLRTYLRSLNASGVGTPTIDLLLSLLQSMSASGVGTATLSEVEQYVRSLSASGVGSATLAQTLLFSVALNASGVGTATLDDIGQFVRSLSASGVGTATLSDLLSAFRSLSATAVGTATLDDIAQYVRTLNASGVGTATLSQSLITLLALNATATGTASLADVVNYLRSLSATATGTASLQDDSTRLLSLNATATGSATRVNRILLDAFLATAVGTATLERGGAEYFESLNATAIGTASLSSAATFLESLSASGVGSAALIRQMYEVLNASGVGTAAFTKQVARDLGQAAAAGTASMDVLFVVTEEMFATATGTASLSMINHWVETLMATAIGTGDLQEQRDYLRTLLLTALGAAALSTITDRNDSMNASGTGSASLSLSFTRPIALNATAVGTATESNTGVIPSGGPIIGDDMRQGTQGAMASVMFPVIPRKDGYRWRRH